MKAVLRPVFLIGLPGAGKTTIGRLLSFRLQLPFIDLDDEIIKKEGAAIKDIFEEKGEDYFRKIEAACLDEQVSKNEAFVISVGGGTPCFFDNITKMKEAGKVCYLEASWKKLASRASLENEVRPLFKNLEKETLEKSLKEKFEWRLPYYSQADVIIKTDEVSPEEIVEAILRKL